MSLSTENVTMGTTQWELGWTSQHHWKQTCPTHRIYLPSAKLKVEKCNFQFKIVTVFNFNEIIIRSQSARNKTV